MTGMPGRDGENRSQGKYASIINEASHLWADFQETNSITNRWRIQLTTHKNQCFYIIQGFRIPFLRWFSCQLKISKTKLFVIFYELDLARPRKMKWLTQDCPTSGKKIWDPIFIFLLSLWFWLCLFIQQPCPFHRSWLFCIFFFLEKLVITSVFKSQVNPQLDP